MPPRKEEGDIFVEGGGLVLASGGVCVVGDLHHLKKEKLERLQRSKSEREVWPCLHMTTPLSSGDFSDQTEFAGTSRRGRGQG